jgi:hypothetical protein
MSKYLTVLFVAMVLLCAFAPTPVKANSIDTFVFQTCMALSGGCFSGNAFNNTYTWQAPSSPTPILFSVGAPDFEITAHVTANGTDVGPATIEFPGVTGGFIIFGNGISIDVLENAVLWSGTDSSPTFTLGTFEMSAMPGPIGMLTITRSSTDVPEPSTLVLTGAGLLVGLAVLAFWRKESASTTCS